MYVNSALIMYCEYSSKTWVLIVTKGLTTDFAYQGNFYSSLTITNLVKVATNMGVKLQLGKPRYDKLSYYRSSQLRRKRCEEKLWQSHLMTIVRNRWTKNFSRVKWLPSFQTTRIGIRLTRTTPRWSLVGSLEKYRDFERLYRWNKLLKSQSKS